MVHLIHKNETGGGICVFIHNMLIYKLWHDVSGDDNESLVKRNNKRKNITIGHYRQTTKW